MLKKKIKYTDFAGNERTEEFYFNLTEAEILEMELMTKGGLKDMIEFIVATEDVAELVRVFKEIIHKSYGMRSPDGRTFVKNDEILADFKNTMAYSELFMELATNEQSAVKFVEGILPPDRKDAGNSPKDYGRK